VRLRVTVPTRQVLAEDGVRRIVAESPAGSFGLLPRHVDRATALVPGILLFEDADGAERLLAVDRGLLVKYGDEVLVAVRRAVAGDELESLRDTVRRRFVALDERERRARTALAELETRFLRRFVEQQGREAT
jgi:F-type H+-transporting ATPase subunit epsilon